MSELSTVKVRAWRRVAPLILGGCLLATALLATACGHLPATSVAASPSASSSGAAADAAPTTTEAPLADLFGQPEPALVPAPSTDTTPVSTSSGQLLVPDFCKPTAVALTRSASGFLLVVRMKGEVPALSSPPPLPFGTTLQFIEFRVGVFAPTISPDRGGGFVFEREYQIPDRPTLEVTRLGEGKEQSQNRQLSQASGTEVRIALPDVGQGTDQVTSWALGVTCVLRHPVDGFYFPASRVPAGANQTMPLQPSANVPSTGGP